MFEINGNEILEFHNGYVTHDVQRNALNIVMFDVIREYVRSVSAIQLSTIEKISVYEKDWIISRETGVRMIHFENFDECRNAASKMEELLDGKVEYMY